MRLSAAERAALVLAAATVLLQALPLGDMLEYRRPLLGTEPWRALTAHLVHVNWPHALVNAAALVVVARLFAPDLRMGRQLLVLAVSAIAISTGLALAFPAIAWYRGLSGVLHALFFAGATAWMFGIRPLELRRAWLPAALLVGGWVKVVIEQPSGAETPFAEWLGAATVPQAHLLGAACGTALGLVFAALDARRRSEGPKQQELRQR